MIDKLTKASFDPHLNTLFKVQTEDMGVVHLELVETEDKSTDVVDCFSLIFKGAKEKILPQKMYTLKHEKMKDAELFVVPIMHDKPDGMYYQVIFNRLKEKPKK